MSRKTNFKHFIIDVDGVLTDGKFYYSSKGKVMKIFGPDDADALSLLVPQMNIHMISGDKRGFAITQKRIKQDMGYPLDLVSTFQRVDWIKSNYQLKNTIYMGDGIFDPLVFKKVGYSIAPQNASPQTKKHADFVTISKGAEGAVAEAVIHILDKFFSGFNIFTHSFTNGSAAWKKQTE